MSFFKKVMLGIDLGTRTLKGVQLSKGRNGKVSLKKYFFQDLAQVTSDYPSTCNREEVLKASLETQDLLYSSTASAVKDAEVMTFNLELPVMSEKELNQVVPLEVGEQAQLNMEDYSCDYVVYPNFVKAHCVKKSVVLEQMKILQEACLKPGLIESEMMAIHAMLEFNDYLEPNEVTVVFDVGDTHVSSGLISGGVLSLTRSQEVSFGRANMKLKDECYVSFAEAETIKQKYDYMLGPVTEKNEMASILDDAFTEVFKAIKTDLEYYHECSESMSRIDRVLLVGGGSQIRSAAKVIEDFLKVPAIVVNPFRNIDIFSNPVASEEIATLAPYMATAVGLALASFAKGGKAA